MSIYVGNLSYEINREHLTKVFTGYGTVRQVHLPTGRNLGLLRGFAFVATETEYEEDKAIKALNKAELIKRGLNINKAKPRENRNSRGGLRNNRF